MVDIVLDDMKGHLTQTQLDRLGLDYWVQPTPYIVLAGGNKTLILQSISIESLNDEPVMARYRTKKGST